MLIIFGEWLATWTDVFIGLIFFWVVWFIIIRAFKRGV